jgi:enterochelin esterase-like enzyme
MRKLMCLVTCTLVLILAGLAAHAAETQKETQKETRKAAKWNNPDGPKLPGVEHGSFRSPSMNVEVGYNVALPAGYAQGNNRYPVVYFLHGAGGNENSDVGGFSRLAARMAAEKKVPPVICVFPNGGIGGYRDLPAQKIMGETMIVKELIPRIDKTYRTHPNREGRVIAGFSMGASGSVRLAFKYPEVFSAAGSWAGAGGSRGGIPPAQLEPDNLRRLAGQVRLLLIVGDKDSTYASYKPLVKNLEEAKYPFRYRVLEDVPHSLGLYYEKTGEEMVLFLTAGFKLQ